MHEYALKYSILQANQSRVQNCRKIFSPTDEAIVAGKCFRMIILGRTTAVSVENTERGDFP